MAASKQYNTLIPINRGHCSHLCFWESSIDRFNITEFLWFCGGFPGGTLYRPGHVSPWSHTRLLNFRPLWQNGSGGPSIGPTDLRSANYRHPHILWTLQETAQLLLSQDLRAALIHWQHCRDFGNHTNSHDAHCKSPHVSHTMNLREQDPRKMFYMFFSQPTTLM